ncbi:MAG: response regulator [Bacteroidota bacterium]|nr:response regulator [Bacteroidota bacterium]
MNRNFIFLVVDDDPDDRDFFLEAISEIYPSSQCLSAFNGEDALDKIRLKLKRLPDFIFLDLNMPRMDGWQCLSELKNDHKLKDIPVIIFTTSSSEKDKKETRDLGAVYFLTKPTDFKLLCSEIRHVVETNLIELESEMHSSRS